MTDLLAAPLRQWLLDRYAAHPIARGCICPPGANRDCESPTCPRKPTQPTGLEYRGG